MKNNRNYTREKSAPRTGASSSGRKPFNSHKDNTSNDRGRSSAGSYTERYSKKEGDFKSPQDQRPNKFNKEDGGRNSTSTRGFHAKKRNDAFESKDRKPYEQKRGTHLRDNTENGSALSNVDRPNREWKADKSYPDNRPFRERKNLNTNSFSKPSYDSSVERKPNTKKWDSPAREAFKRPIKKKATNPIHSDLIRLNQYIAHAGICSRRKADDFISAGLISINGKIVSEVGSRVHPQNDEVRYNGALIKRQKMVYILLNKPKDYITTTDDPRERRTVIDLISKTTKERVYPVGRLDRNTTGLLLLTNDGDLAEKLSHPRNQVPKLYHVTLNRNFVQGDFNKLSAGLELEDGFTKPDDLSYVQGAGKSELGIRLHSGKNRIVRRLFEHLGYEVVKLDRVVYANLTKKDLPRGRCRHLEPKEIVQLKHLLQVE